MTKANFIQIHSLHGYSSVLLNRDDSGHAKRIPYGGTIRTRISSQCLKRHWRIADDENALSKIDGATAAFRSREIISRKVIDPLREEVDNQELIEAINDGMQRAVYGENAQDSGSRQPLLLGEPEINYLAHEAKKISDQYDGDIKAIRKSIKEWGKSFKSNFKVMRENCTLPAGLVSALFGRMVTSDTEANIDAAIHVAHSFTVHEDSSESDYFTVVDDLRSMSEDAGAAHIGETELSSGLYYGYVVVDRGMLLQNLANDHDMAGEVVRRLIHLIATVSPGAKLGSTAPYHYASWMLAEAGSRQPRSLAESFRVACRPLLEESEAAISKHLQILDEAYGYHEQRRVMSLSGANLQNATQLPLAELAEWAANSVKSGEC